MDSTYPQAAKPIELQVAQIRRDNADVAEGLKAFKMSGSYGLAEIEEWICCLEYVLLFDNNPLIRDKLTSLYWYRHFQQS